MEQVFKTDLEQGDMVVLGSDGLFDNLYDQDIESVLSTIGGPDQDSAQRGGKYTPISHRTS